MVWPKGLKDQIKSAAGDRTITEFVIEAVNIHLGQVGSRDRLAVQLGETEYFAQLLADRLVMGGSDSDRLQALMEVDFPSWIVTDGWPEAAAKLVRQHPLTPEPPVDAQEGGGEEVTPDDAVTQQTAEGAVPDGSTRTPDEWPERQPTPPLRVEEPDEAPWRITESKSPREDLFARVKGKLDDVPGLVPASKLPVPPKPPVEPPVEPVVDTSGLCPDCKDELIDGVCWTCS